MHEEMSQLELTAHRRWLADASHVHFGRCSRCDRVRESDGKPLLVARQARARRFLCFVCWLETI